MSLLKSWKFWVSLIVCVWCGRVCRGSFATITSFRCFSALLCSPRSGWPGTWSAAMQDNSRSATSRSLAWALTGWRSLLNLAFPSGSPLFLAALVSTAFAAVIGAISFRLRGPYFTLATIAFAEVLRLAATNLNVTGGAIGLTMPGLFIGRTFWRSFYLAAVALAVVSFLSNYWASRSRFGYYLMAIREDEDTAAAVGINTARCKLYSLLMSAFLTALGGALYGSAFQFIVPDSILTIDISIQIAIITMLGGAGTLLGPIVGAVLLLSASEAFKNVFQESHLLIYGVLIVVVVLFLPEGIVGGLQHRFRKRIKPPKDAKPQPVLGGAAQ